MGQTEPLQGANVPRSVFEAGVLGRAWLVALLVGAAPLLPAAVTAYRSTVDIPAYPWWPAVPHPYFRATDGRNIYPYPMLDNLKRVKEPHRWQTVVLENELLKVTFLPELGGKIYEVVDKPTGQQVFYVNHVAKPGLIGQCGAWVSGGIEWNTGPAGHTVSAVQPVDVQILPPAADGSLTVAVGEVEKIYRTRWTVQVTLRPGRSFLEESIRIYNGNETVRPYYFWNCTAAPNTHGFRFVYPMTLGTDHSGNTFYTWPMADGKDLSLGRTYEDASSIFAYQCDQDFFGSYDEEADRGVVAYANHHLLPGKKAWTWGYGSYGTMHQMDLTDTDGPYNEVQTGPLPTQADVGRLDPGEAVSWQEWWYPVRGLGGFTFANRDVAVNVSSHEQGLRLRLIGTGTWSPAQVRLRHGTQLLAKAPCSISPLKPSDLSLGVPHPQEPVEVEISHGTTILAQFRAPLDLPLRTPPKKKPAPQTVEEWIQAGWQDYLFAHLPEAESRFQQALAKDPQAIGAHVGLAYLRLDSAPAASIAEARAALAVDPDTGPAHFVLASAKARLGQTAEALEEAWKATLDPATAVPGRALVGKLLLQQGHCAAAAQALFAAGPWREDPQCRNRLALAWLKSGQTKDAIQLARQELQEEPLDAAARSILWLAKAEPKSLTLGELISANPESVLELAAEYDGLGQTDIALRVVEEFYVKQVAAKDRQPLPLYWAAALAHRLGQEPLATDYLRQARSLPIKGVFPHRYETAPVLRWAVQTDPKDGHAALALGHLLFSLGRYAEGRAHWQMAAELGAEPAVAYRALAMACRQLDGNPSGALDLFRRAQQADPTDPIVAMDVARLLLAQADQAGAEPKQHALLTQTAQILSGALQTGQHRSDFVALLARAQNQLGEYAQTARLLDSVRITIWEGAREAHDLFEAAHLALGNEHLKAGRPAQALAEFNRALEYPANLATGRLQNAREAHIQYLRGNALAALGQQDEAVRAWHKAADEPPSNRTHDQEARAKAKAALENVGR